MWPLRFAARRVPGLCALVLVMLAARPSTAGNIYVPAGGDLQAALNNALPGDTILLDPGATYVGNFRLPVHTGTTYITIRSAAADSLLPPAGARMSPAYSPYLPKLQSPNGTPALRTAPAAAFWRVMFVEFEANLKGLGDIIALGDGSSAQNTLSLVPHHLILDRVYVHGDPLNGQKRGISLNTGLTSILNSYVSDIKAVGQDTQAIAGWNGPGPYDVENNYLEASTEVFLLGGDDPKIPDLTPSDVVIRGNTLTRPLSWRDPLLATPSGVRASVTADGSLAAGTYGYRVVARRTLPDTTMARSLASADVTATVAAGARVALTWTPVPDATEYLVYGRTAGAQKMYWRVTTPAFSDDGLAAATAGTPPTSATVWQVKNVLELKNASRVQIDYNVIENNWAQAQAGIAVLFTPRNQYGSCTWCVVKDVTFEYNVIRSIGGAINIQGWDNEQASQQTVNVRIRHNEIYDLNKSWGGNGFFLQLLRQPQDIVIDHNTIVSTNGGGLVNVDSLPMTGFVFTNNVGRHNSYGIIGANRGPGMQTISYFFPDGVVTRNVFAGGSASAYPAGNLFPTVTGFENHFVGYAANDFTLVPGTDWAHAGTDGLDLGADAGTVHAARVSAESTPPEVATASLPSTPELAFYATALQVAGGIAPFRWSLIAGALPSGLALDPLTGNIAGSASMRGDHAFTVQVADTTGATASRPLSIHVDQAIPPVDIVTGTVTAATATLPFMQAFDAVGGLGTYVWSFAGTLPPGLSFSGNGVLSGTPAVQGTWTFTLRATDAVDATRFAERSLTMTVARPPNKAPTVSLIAPVDVAVGATLTLSAAAADSDGGVARVDFYLDGALVGSAASTGSGSGMSAQGTFALTWPVTQSGSYSFTAIAVDDLGAASPTAAATVATKSEVVVYAAQAVRTVGNFQLVADGGAAAGKVMWNPNQNAAKVGTALASPASYVELTFPAEAGRPYHLWIRARAEKNDYSNDSVYVQFDGVAAARIGTTSALPVILEEGPNAGVSGYGWTDDVYGGFGSSIVFERTGMQTIRIQPREDGFMFDQIVLSPQRYLTGAPGAAKNDVTILGQ